MNTEVTWFYFSLSPSFSALSVIFRSLLFSLPFWIVVGTLIGRERMRRGHGTHTDTQCVLYCHCIAARATSHAVHTHTHKHAHMLYICRSSKTNVGAAAVLCNNTSIRATAVFFFMRLPPLLYTRTHTLTSFQLCVIYI